MICRHFKEPSGSGKNCSSWNGHLRRALKALPKDSHVKMQNNRAELFLWSCIFFTAQVFAALLTKSLLKQILNPKED